MLGAAHTIFSNNNDKRYENASMVGDSKTVARSKFEEKSAFFLVTLELNDGLR